MLNKIHQKEAQNIDKLFVSEQPVGTGNFFLQKTNLPIISTHQLTTDLGTKLFVRRSSNFLFA